MSARITQPDVLLPNGVIHVIDGVLWNEERGEAEARGEVEFLRGEVERGRSELRREREKAAAALKGAEGGVVSSREMEQKDDEIRGLKAIVHSLSSNPDGAATNGEGSIADPDELKKARDARPK